MQKLVIQELDEMEGIIRLGITDGEEILYDHDYFESALTEGDTITLPCYGGNIGIPRNCAVSIQTARGQILGVVRAPLFIGEAYGVTDIIIPKEADLNLDLKAKNHLNLDGKSIRHKRHNDGITYHGLIEDLVDQANRCEDINFRTENDALYADGFLEYDELDGCIKHKLVYANQERGILRVRRMVVPSMANQNLAESQDSKPPKAHTLEDKLRVAEREERYEDAARLRDQIARTSKNQSKPL